MKKNRYTICVILVQLLSSRTAIPATHSTKRSSSLCDRITTSLLRILIATPHEDTPLSHVEAEEGKKDDRQPQRFFTFSETHIESSAPLWQIRRERLPHYLDIPLLQLPPSLKAPNPCCRCWP